MSCAHVIVERESVPPLVPGQQTERASVTFLHVFAWEVPSDETVTPFATEPDTGFSFSLWIDAIVVYFALSAFCTICGRVPRDCYILLEASVRSAISHGKVWLQDCCCAELCSRHGCVVYVALGCIAQYAAPCQPKDLRQQRAYSLLWSGAWRHAIA